MFVQFSEAFFVLSYRPGDLMLQRSSLKNFRKPQGRGSTLVFRASRSTMFIMSISRV